MGGLEGLRSVVGRRWVLRGALRRVSVLGALVLAMSLVAFLIFGWTTALIVNVAQHVYPHRGEHGDG